MNKDNLLKRLASLGFPLLEVQKDEEVNSTLADLVASHDLRLWEGFPVVLANSAEKGLFDYDKVAEEYLKSPSDRVNLALLVVLSLALYKTLGLKFAWVDKLDALFNNENMKQEYEKDLAALKSNQDLYVQNRVLSSQRVRATFDNYFRQTQAHLNDLLSVKEEMGVEYSLSQVFSPKQKELFLKKLRNEKLTKTEKEYFSRVVKKRVLAFANPELHRLAQKLLQNL
ncbi:MAG: hypothetical protein KKC39_03350 [Candidatus Omnitrophica bacterium]|nr:hypothetical protein [Candidatus Omnitrophota bacterium]MBU4303296.1 hypothetical protein [Candidatus Omnitrophota bacterium]MBU4418405.1 hypothetical protein [Candidatus Omnitrophota bacterium]MBU4467765.1 hypothetical protein [Candidatus Omnitrophota bacterium]MCG2708038.1 hypothetical protein [Candidatus Omnitrophota bacterium]